MTTSPMAPCRLGITTDTLSALRDGALSATEAQPLRAHIPTCGACQARLAGFDRVARALGMQRDLEPDGRIWAALEPRITRKEYAPMQNARRSIISGGIAAISVVIIVALFALVLVNHRGGGPASVVATKPPITTPGQTASPPNKPTPQPTSTPISFNGLPTPQQVWGAGAAQATVNIGDLKVGGLSAIGGLTPDGQHILGYRTSTDGKNYEVGWLTVATGNFTIFDQFAVNGQYKPNGPPVCCMTDGRFVVGADRGNESSTATFPWYYDTQTGQRHAITSADFSFFPFGVHGGVVYHEATSAEQHSALYGLNLLTGADAPVAGTSSIFNVGKFAWPIFTYTTINTSGDVTTLHAHNLQTGADVALPQLGNYDTAAFPSAVPIADGLIFITTDATGTRLQAWDHIFTVGSAPVALTPLLAGVNQLIGANARGVLIPDTDYSCSAAGVPCNYSLAWDRVLHKLVLLSPSNSTDALLNGDYFAVIDHKTNVATIYNSATFPTR